MSIQHNYAFSWNNGSTPVQASVAAQGDGEDNRSLSCPQGSTNVLMAWHDALLVGLFILADQDCTITFRHNGTGGDTAMVFDAGIPYVWISGMPVTLPFSGLDVVSISISVPGATAANVNICALSDTTP